LPPKGQRKLWLTCVAHALLLRSKEGSFYCIFGLHSARISFLLCPYGARNDLFDFGPPTLCPYGAMKTLRIELPIACYQFPRKFSNLFLPIVSCLLPIASCLLPIPTKVQQSSFACCQLLARRSFSEGGPIAYSHESSRISCALCLGPCAFPITCPTTTSYSTYPHPFLRSRHSHSLCSLTTLMLDNRSSLGKSHWEHLDCSVDHMGWALKLENLIF